MPSNLTYKTTNTVAWSPETRCNSAATIASPSELRLLACQAPLEFRILSLKTHLIELIIKD